MVKIRFIFLKHNVVIVTRLPVQPQPKALWGVEKDTIKDGGLKTRVCVFSCVESACVESLSGVQTLALRIAKIILSSGMASKSIPPMDITGSKSELSERWRVWLRGFTYAEGKANLHTERREKQKRTTLSSCLRGTGHFRESGTPVVPPQKGQDGDDVYQQIEHRTLIIKCKKIPRKECSSPATPRTRRRCRLICASTSQASKALWL